MGRDSSPKASRVGRSGSNSHVALRPTATDGTYRVCYAAFPLGLIDLSAPSPVPKGHYHPLTALPKMCYP